MEPQLPTPESPGVHPDLRGEKQSPIVGNESLPQPAIERAPAPISSEKSGERQVSHGGGDPTWTARPVAPVLPTDPLVQNDDVNSTQVDDTPSVAHDDDLIEKEWVDRAKMVVKATKDDPYKQEQEISKLQADYLKKRYGKEVKIPSE